MEHVSVQLLVPLGIAKQIDEKDGRYPVLRTQPAAVVDDIPAGRVPELLLDKLTKHPDSALAIRLAVVLRCAEGIEEPVAYGIAAIFPGAAQAEGHLPFKDIELVIVARQWAKDDSAISYGETVAAGCRLDEAPDFIPMLVVEAVLIHCQVSRVPMRLRSRKLVMRQIDDEVTGQMADAALLHRAEDEVQLLGLEYGIHRPAKNQIPLQRVAFYLASSIQSCGIAVLRSHPLEHGDAREQLETGGWRHQRVCSEGEERCVSRDVVDIDCYMVAPFYTMKHGVKTMAQLAVWNDDVLLSLWRRLRRPLAASRKEQGHNKQKWTETLKRQFGAYNGQ